MFEAAQDGNPETWKGTDAINFLTMRF